MSRSVSVSVSVSVLELESVRICKCSVDGSLDKLVQYAEAGRCLVDLVKVPLELTAPGVLVVHWIHADEVWHYLPVMVADDLSGHKSIGARLNVEFGFEIRLTALVANDCLPIGSRN